MPGEMGIGSEDASTPHALSYDRSGLAWIPIRRNDLKKFKKSSAFSRIPMLGIS
jgi:hypothetical protein